MNYIRASDRTPNAIIARFKHKHMIELASGDLERFNYAKRSLVNDYDYIAIGKP